MVTVWVETIRHFETVRVISLDELRRLQQIVRAASRLNQWLRNNAKLRNVIGLLVLKIILISAAVAGAGDDLVTGLLIQGCLVFAITVKYLSFGVISKVRRSNAPIQVDHIVATLITLPIQRLHIGYSKINLLINVWKSQWLSI